MYETCVKVLIQHGFYRYKILKNYSHKNNNALKSHQNEKKIINFQLNFNDGEGNYIFFTYIFLTNENNYTTFRSLSIIVVQKTLVWNLWYDPTQHHLN